MSGEFGSAETDRLDVVELPEDSVSAAWAPGVIAIKPSHGSARLLANTVAHQWWGSEVSPATLGDAWITNGMSRYAELMYVQETSGNAAFESAVADVEAGALAYDTVPLTSLGGIDPFSPQFQSMTLEKGAMVFHMLRWEMGDAVFQQFLQALVKQYADKGVSTADVKTLAEKYFQAAADGVLFAVAGWNRSTASTPIATASFDWEATRDFAPWGRYRRILTCFRCRLSCASRPRVRQWIGEWICQEARRSIRLTPLDGRQRSSWIRITGC